MRIVCPICSAAYDVPDAMLAPGRSARCARCTEEWVPLPGAPAPPAPPASEPTESPPPEPPEPSVQEPAAPPPLTAMDRLAAQPASLPRASAALRAAWVASFLLVALLVWSGFAWRTELMHAWPPSIRLYDAVGLAPPSPTH